MADKKNDKAGQKKTEEQPKNDTPAPSADAKAAPKPKTGNWVIRLEKRLGGVKTGFLVLLKGLISRDSPTRWASLLFFVALVGFGYTFVKGWGKVSQFVRAHTEVEEVAPSQAENLNALFTKQSTEAKALTSKYGLGNFIVELVSVKGQERVPGMVNMAEIEIWVECDSKRTCDFIKDNVFKVRDQVTQVLQAVDREDVLTFMGKRRIKKTIRRKLNLWLTDGHIKEIYFTRLHMG